MKQTTKFIFAAAVLIALQLGAVTGCVGYVGDGGGGGGVYYGGDPWIHGDVIVGGGRGYYGHGGGYVHPGGGHFGGRR